jgi:hypothetical protein
MRAFQELLESAKIVHIAALCCIALTIILLIAPASLHPISFAGEDDPALRCERCHTQSETDLNGPLIYPC